MVLKFEVAKGNNIITVEYGTEDKEGYQQLLDYAENFATLQCVNGTFTQKGNTTEISGVYEGRLAYAKIERKKTVDGKIKYLMISYQLRPELQKAYQGAIDQMAQSIVLQ